MALDFCRGCYAEYFGEDGSDFEGLTTAEDTAAGLYAPAICFTCGVIAVDHTGTAVVIYPEEDEGEKDMTSVATLPFPAYTPIPNGEAGEWITGKELLNLEEGAYEVLYESYVMGNAIVASGQSLRVGRATLASTTYSSYANSTFRSYTAHMQPLKDGAGKSEKVWLSAYLNSSTNHIVAARKLLGDSLTSHNDKLASLAKAA